MKVAFFQPYLANWRIQFLEYYVRQCDFEVIVYDGGFSAKKDKKSVTGHQTSLTYHRFWSWSPIFSIRGQEYPFYFSPGLFFRLLKDRPDVVITEGEINFVNNISVFLYCFLLRKKYVWWSLGKVRTRKKNIVNRLLDPLVDFLLSKSDSVMARNTYAKQYYMTEKAVPERKIIVAPNSMDDERARLEFDESLYKELLQIKSGHPVILYVGALVASKKPADIIEAVNLFADAKLRQSVQVWYVGDGPERPALQAMVKGSDIESRVFFFGKKFHGVGAYFKAAELTVVPGLGGLVINHAMIFGCPVVSRPADGTEQDLVLDGETGYLVNDGSNQRLAEAIEKVLLDDQIDLMRRNAEKLVASSWNIALMSERVSMSIKMAHEGPGRAR